MAQRTIAAGGGNWNSTATWVEGAVPTTSDFVVGNASSGQLTVNVGATVQYVDFSAYTSTITFNNFLQTNLASQTNIFGASMSFSGTNRFNFYNVNGTIIQNTTNRIPFLATANTSKTYSGNIYCTNFIHENAQTHTGGNVYISGNYTNNGDNGGTTKFIMDGTGTLAGFLTSTETIINTTGTTTIQTAGWGIGANLNNNSTAIFRHQAGTIVNPKFRSFLNYGASGSTLIDLISGTTWNITLYSQSSTTSVPSLVNFNGSCTFNNFFVSGTGGKADSSSPTNSNSIRLSGATLNISNFQLQNNFQNFGGDQGIADMILYLQTGQTINISSQFNCNGGMNYGTALLNPNLEIRTFNSGATANLNINTNNQYISSAKFTDIDCSGGNAVYGQNLTLTRTTNITQYTLPPSGGGGASSYTFIS